MRNHARGFSIIEIMIVLGILAIVMAFAVPMYQDYSTRAKFSECLGLQGPAQQKIAEYVIANASMPPTQEIVVSRPTRYCEEGAYVRQDARTGLLMVGMNETAVGVDAGAVVEARLEAHKCDNRDVEWACYYASSGGDTLQGRYLPASCRTTAVEFSASCL